MGSGRVAAKIARKSYKSVVCSGVTVLGGTRQDGVLFGDRRFLFLARLGHDYGTTFGTT